MKTHCFQSEGQLGRTLLAAAVFALCVAAPLAAQPSPQNQDAAVMQFLRRVEISGFVDGYYSYNFNTPANGKAGPERTFDIFHNSFSLNLAELALEKKPTDDSRVGFRLDLDYGQTANIVKAAEPGGTQIYQNIGQAYVSFLAPVGKGWQFDFGEFVTPAGYEVIKTKDNWNYSRSVLFTLAKPFYHMGMRTTYSFNDRVSVAGYVVNGWNNIVDNNSRKTVGAQAAVKPFKSLTITETYLGGAEQKGTNAWRHLSDTVATLTLTPKLSLAGNYDYGQDKQSGATVQWQGVAGYARLQPSSWFAVSPRFEYYNDRDGFTSGMAQKIKEITVTGELKHKDGFLMRLEYRHDFSDIPFWLKNNRFIDHQDTFTIGVLYSLSSRGI